MTAYSRHYYLYIRLGLRLLDPIERNDPATAVYVIPRMREQLIN
jgi:hypothetical protein